MPDEKLLARAAAGTLRNPVTLAAEARRMLKDQRARGLATEFGGNWLDVRRFEEINTVDRERFPMFDNALRQAMFEEPVRFLLDVIRNDRSVLEFVNAKHTFVNPVLAKYYGIPGITGGPEEWTRVDDATPYDRGKRPRHAHESREAWILDCQARAGRTDSAAARGGSRTST